MREPGNRIDDETSKSASDYILRIMNFEIIIEYGSKNEKYALGSRSSARKPVIHKLNVKCSVFQAEIFAH